MSATVIAMLDASDIVGARPAQGLIVHYLQNVCLLFEQSSYFVLRQLTANDLLDKLVSHAVAGLPIRLILLEHVHYKLLLFQLMRAHF